MVSEKDVCLNTGERVMKIDVLYKIVNTVIEPGFMNTVTVVLGAKHVTKHAETGIAVSVT